MVNRMDLDGTYSPIGLVTKILKAEPNLKIPIPIEELAYELDISEIQTLKTEGFEGGLITDENRTDGFILVKRGMNPLRRRYTIGHELGHFLIIHHKPISGTEFLCDREAMKEQNLKTQERAQKMEAEANRFASLLLMPPPYLNPIINGKSYANLKTVLEIHDHFEVSKEAAAWAYAEYNPEMIAVLIVKDGRYLRHYCKKGFPWITINRGDKVPDISLVHKQRQIGSLSDSDPTGAEHWIETNYGKPVPKMYEQVLFQSNGYAMIQLKVLQSEDWDYDPDENLTSKQRYQKRQERWQR